MHRKLRVVQWATTLTLLFCSLQSISQIVTVLQMENDLPLEYVTITSEDHRNTQITNAKGQANLSDFPADAVLRVRLIGYHAVDLTLAEVLENDGIIKLAPSNISLDQVVLTATRWDEFSRDIPMKISTISASDIELRNPQTTADLVGSSGEVFIQKSQQGGGSPMIRGFATNRLLMVVDGVRMNNAIFRSGNLHNILSIDPFSLERSEVLFGPSSVIYGSDAIGGVMSFNSIQPQFTLQEEPLISGGAMIRHATANREFSQNVNVKIGWKKWAVASNFSFNQFGDLRMGAHGPDDYLNSFYVMRFDSADHVIQNQDPELQVNTGYDQTNMMQKIRFRPHQGLELEYSFRFSETSKYNRYDRLIQVRNNLPRSAEWAYGPQRWALHLLTLKAEEPRLLYDGLEVRIAQQHFEESRLSRDFNDVERQERYETVDATSMNIDARKFAGERHEFYYGLEGVLNDVNSRGIERNIETNESQLGPARYPESTWASTAIYITHQMKVTPKSHLRSGLRYNLIQINSAFDTTFYPFPFTEASLSPQAVTGALGWVWNPTDAWKLTASVSTAFRAPNIDDMGKVFDSSPGTVLVPNPELESEYAYHGEVSASHLLGNSVVLSATGYGTHLADAMVRRNYSLNGVDSMMYDGAWSAVQAIQNAAFIRIVGLQGGVEAKLPNGFEFSARVNYQTGVEEMDDGTTSTPRHVAPLFGNIRLGYQMQKLKAEIRSIYNGAVEADQLAISERDKPHLYALDADGQPYAPAWHTINFNLQYALNSTFQVTAGIENITDLRYRPYASGLTAPGRNLMIALKGSF